MFSFLIVALFAVLSLSVSACPVRSNIDQLPTYTTTPIPSTYLAPTPSPSTPTPSVPVSPPTQASVSLENTGGVYVHLSIPVLALIVPRSATYFYQDGVAGACGVVHSDSDYICAMGMFSRSFPRPLSHFLPQIRLFMATRILSPLSAVIKSKSLT